MMALAPKAVRWEPAAGIPESPCADFMLESYETGVAKLMLRYSWVKDNNFDLLLTFTETLAIRTYWDGDGPGNTMDSNPPRCSGAHSDYIWPLLEIEQSHWLNCGDFAASITIAEATKKAPWRYYKILTLERSLDILARGAIVGEWVALAIPGD